MSDEQAEALITASYDLATATTGIDAIPALFSAATGYGSALVTLRRGLTPVELATNLAPSVVAAYAGHYHRIDPWTRMIDQAPRDVVVHGSWSSVRAGFEDTEFYQDFARPQGLIDPLGVRMQVAAGLELHVGINRRLQPGDPDPREMARFAALARHLQRGLSLRERFAALERRNGVALELLDQLVFGIAVLEATGAIIFLNRCAETLIAERPGIAVRQGRLVALAPADQARLRGALADVMAGGAGGAMLLRHPADDGMIAMLVSRLPQQFSAGAGPMRAMVTLTDLRRGNAMDAEGLRALFGLTGAEAEVAAGIAAGQSVDHLAERRGVRPSTIKTQLEGVFAKTGARSQRDLAQLLGRLPALG